jgi:hypothetical protein
MHQTNIKIEELRFGAIKQVRDGKNLDLREQKKQGWGELRNE